MISTNFSTPTMPHVPKIPWRRVGITTLIFVVMVLCFQPFVSTVVRIVPVSQTITYLEVKSVTVNARNPIPKEFPKEGLKVRGEGKQGTVFLLKFYTFVNHCQMWFGHEWKWHWFTFEEWTSGTLPGFNGPDWDCTSENVIRTLEAHARVADTEIKEWLDTVIRLMKVQWRWTG